MASHSDTAKRWADLTLGRETREVSSANVHIRRVDKSYRLYSYGSHFELGRMVTEEDGSRFYLLNGDTYSVTTSRHQSMTRDAAHGTGLPVLIVPHTAMASAGIVLDSIRPVDIEDERTEKTSHRVSVPDLVKLGEDVASGRFGWDRSGSDADKERGTYSLTQSYSIVTEDGTKYTASACKRGYDYTPNTFVDYDPPRMSYYRNGGALEHVSDDVFRYDTWRHFLGGSVFRAKVRETVETKCPNHCAGTDAPWCDTCGSHASGSGIVRTDRTRSAYFVSGFDETGQGRPLYFLAELPANAKPESYADALAVLKPAAVNDAEACGIEVARQGDIFAIPSPGTAERLPIPFRYADKRKPCPLDGTGRHIATELVTLTSADGKTVRVFARGTLTHAGGEHKRLRLPEWHELVRNTVPMQSTHTRGHDARFSMPPGVRAWTIRGSVD